MFDMQAIGKRISAMRKKCNMTQTELADRLGISYQAVSNWERGNSMPDIEKLPELADIFSCSVDELLGRKSPLVDSAMRDSLGEYVKNHNVTVDELQDALPILKPEQVTSIVHTLNPERIREVRVHLEHMGDTIDAAMHKPQEEETGLGEEHVDALLPFMDSEDVRELAQCYAQAGQSIVSFLPFMAEEDVARLASLQAEAGGSLAAYLPFLPTKDVMAFARKAEEKGESLTVYLPFMPSDEVGELARKASKKGESTAAFLPFMRGEEVVDLAKQAQEKGESLAAFLPFLPAEEVNLMAAAAAEKGESIDIFLPFMDKQELMAMAMRRMRESMSRLREKKGGRHEE